MEILGPFVAIVGFVLLIAAIWVIVIYNRFVALRQHMRESWSDIDLELKRRYDLIPNLVETVRGYARHEKETLALVIERRNKAQANHGRADSQAADESQLMLSVKQLFALAENYPDLKADKNFLELQRELANTEDRIAAARRFYNANVRELRQLKETFPTNIVGNTFNIEDAAYFELSTNAERITPRVNL
jgi:LemA protein